MCHRFVNSFNNHLFAEISTTGHIEGLSTINKQEQNPSCIEINGDVSIIYQDREDRIPIIVGETLKNLKKENQTLQTKVKDLENKMEKMEKMEKMVIEMYYAPPEEGGPMYEQGKTSFGILQRGLKK